MKKKIYYFDNFKNIKVNSNGYWLRAFEEYGDVRMFDINRMKNRLTGFFEKARVKKDMLSFAPDCIHFGGSAKTPRKMPPDFVKWARETFPEARITFFYGDGYNIEEYYNSIENHVDAFFMTNMSFVKDSRYNFLVCPVPAELERQWNPVKENNLVFIGNNYNRDRFAAVNHLREKFGMRVYGNDWPPEFGAYHVYYDKDYADVCANSWIVMADPAGPLCRNSDGDKCVAVDSKGTYSKGVCRDKTCNRYSEMAAYLSNRTANTMLACAVHLVPYVKEIENHFENWKDIVWYRDDEERDEIIEYLLSNPEKCREIAVGAALKARNFTFEKAAARVIGI